MSGRGKWGAEIGRYLHEALTKAHELYQWCQTQQSWFWG